jgi:DNA-binding transcriptional MerR regulator
MAARWTLEELTQAVGAALAEGYDGPADARAREVPDARTIRYYTTLGLLDRAAEMRGRTALYSEKHLRQIVAIKRLQADGLSLAEVQERLAGASPRRLQELAGIDVDDVARKVASATKAAAPARARFWAAAPAAPSAPSAPAPMASLLDVAGTSLPVAAPLGGGLQLLFTPARPLDADDVVALAEAARAIHETLRSRGLMPSGT